MARRRSRGIRGSGTIDQLPSGRWRLRVPADGKQVTYGIYLTEDEASTAQARWKLTELLPTDDPPPPFPALCGCPDRDRRPPPRYRRPSAPVLPVG